MLYRGARARCHENYCTYINRGRAAYAHLSASQGYQGCGNNTGAGRPDIIKFVIERRPQSTAKTVYAGLKALMNDGYVIGNSMRGGPGGKNAFRLRSKADTQTHVFEMWAKVDGVRPCYRGGQTCDCPRIVSGAS